MPVRSPPPPPHHGAVHTAAARVASLTVRRSQVARLGLNQHWFRRARLHHSNADSDCSLDGSAVPNRLKSCDSRGCEAEAVWHSLRFTWCNHARMHTRSLACSHARTHARMHGICTACARVCSPTCAGIYLHPCPHVSTCACVCVCRHTHMCVEMCKACVHGTHTHLHAYVAFLFVRHRRLSSKGALRTAPS